MALHCLPYDCVTFRFPIKYSMEIKLHRIFPRKCVLPSTSTAHLSHKGGKIIKYIRLKYKHVSINGIRLHVVAIVGFFLLKSVTVTRHEVCIYRYIWSTADYHRRRRATGVTTTDDSSRGEIHVGVLGTMTPLKKSFP